MAKISLFANYSKLVIIVRTKDDALFLQRQIGVFINWSQSNFLSSNVQKCQIISFSRSKVPIEFHYGIQGVRLSNVGCVKDLRVHLGSRLNFKDHLQCITSGALRTMGMMLRKTVCFFPDTVATVI